MTKLSALLLLLALPGLAAADVPAAPPLDQGTRDYVRFKEAGGQPDALEVSIVGFAPAAGGSGPEYRVDLVSAVHVGDDSYYQYLNERLKKYDVVLYELVAPQGTRVPKGGFDPDRENKSFAARLQGGMKDVLELSYQLEQVDYSPKHFVHADLSPEEFDASMKSRGESFFQLLLNAWLTGLAYPQQSMAVSDFDLIAALFSDDRPRRLKILMARQFHHMDQMMRLLDGGEQGSTLISVRNQRALDVLREQIGKGHQRIAIFYGAGHMMDLADRLETDFQLRAVEQTWVNAWDLKP
ncbi:MAG: hypothetical protein AAGA23_03480 [Pseudomonadota bacterium]